AWYDIILTDINMPIMDGLKLVQKVRSDPELRHIPIIIITTESGAEDRERALALGANAYIIKPIQAPVIIATVTELLSLDGGPRAGRPAAGRRARRAVSGGRLDGLGPSPSRGPQVPPSTMLWTASSIT